MAENSVKVRGARAADVDAILDLLEPTDFVKPLTRDDLRKLFTYTWSDKLDFGKVVVDGDIVGGFGATTYSPPRQLGDRQFAVTNVGTMFVRPRYRARRTESGVVRYSDELIQAAIEDGNPIVAQSARGPNDVVVTLLTDRGFRQISSREIFYTPGSDWTTALRPAGQVTSERAVFSRHLTHEQARILDHHAPYGCRFTLVREGDETCFVVTKQRRYRGTWLWPWFKTPRISGRTFAVSDVLHLSNAALAIRSWGRLVAHTCLRDRSVGLTCAESFLGPSAPDGTSVPQRILALTRGVPDDRVDKLYSEVVLLP